SALARTSVITTLIPAARHACAIPKPIPLAAPVMKATLPSRCSIGFSARLAIEPDSQAPKTRLRLAVEGHDERVMAGDDVSRLTGQLSKSFPTQGHLHDIRHDREGTTRGHVGQIMCCVRGQHHPADAGPDSHYLQPMSMTAYMMHSDTRDDFG